MLMIDLRKGGRRTWATLWIILMLLFFGVLFPRLLGLLGRPS